jgi:hypothetical protein
MYYEINVAKLGKDGHYFHYFATAERSVTDIEKLKNLMKGFLLAFPKPEFEISVIEYQTVGKGIDLEEIFPTKKYLHSKDLVRGYYLFGGKGDVWGGTAHIAKASESGTLCKKPMLSTNWVKLMDVEEAGCPDCINEYKRREDSDNVNNDDKIN